MNEIINTIIDSIENGKCVLVLGPDLYVKEINGSLVERKQYFLEIEKAVKSCIYFPNEDVFDYKLDDRMIIKGKIKEFYTGGGDDNLFELISTIKFPLILNVSPDSALIDFCGTNGVPLKFGKFSGDHDETSHVEFNAEDPLFYNLLGYYRDTQYIIADHKQLFKHIQKILPETSFPINIQKFLSRASSIIFLGFKFNSWIFQLMSHKILNHKNESAQDDDRLRLSHCELNLSELDEIKANMENNSIKSTNIEKENFVNIVMTSSVGMRFTEISPSQLISDIIAGLKTKGLAEYVRDVRNQEKYSSYLSYAHPPKEQAEPNTGTITNALLHTFHEKNTDKAHFKIVFDKDGLSYGQSIDSFMTRIGKGKTAVMVVNDKYMKSEYCMTEATRIFKYNNDDERIFVIVVKDTLRPKDEYEIFWKEKALELVKNNKTKIEEINRAIEFSNHIPFFFEKLNKTLNLEISTTDFNQSADGVFALNKETQKKLDDFISVILQKLKS